MANVTSTTWTDRNTALIHVCFVMYRIVAKCSGVQLCGFNSNHEIYARDLQRACLRAHMLHQLQKRNRKILPEHDLPKKFPTKI